MDDNQDLTQDLDTQNPDTKDIKAQTRPLEVVYDLNTQSADTEGLDTQNPDTKDIKAETRPGYVVYNINTESADTDTQEIVTHEPRRGYIVDIDSLGPAKPVEEDTEDWFASDDEPEAEVELKVEEPEILRRLKGFLKSKPTLASFFSADLSTEAERATRMANKLITEEQCPDKEVARELALLCMYDLVLLIGTLPPRPLTKDSRPLMAAQMTPRR